LRDFLTLDIHDVWGSTGAALELISLFSISTTVPRTESGYWR
jgi:hypothetical protein